MRAIITGAAQGLGAAIAERLVCDGANAILLDLKPEVSETAARIASTRAGSQVLPLVSDVSEESSCRRAAEMAVERLGGIDALVNNAGIGGPSADLVDTELADFLRVLDANLVGSFLMAREAGRVMIRQGSGGAIVNLSSMFGQRGEPGGCAYCASKGGVILLTDCLALELAPHGIRVNSVAPGHMATEMHWDDLRARALAQGTSLQDQVDKVRASIPLGRHGTGTDVAAAVAWLVSSQAAYITGQTLAVNGGVLLN
jgi:NAD(P)-dependent dehydrogenase (short-subunit alcohol dehydrogenase family)